MPRVDTTRWTQVAEGTYTRDPGVASEQEESWEESWEAWTKADLVAELKLRGLPTSGSKAELIERLSE